MKQLTHRNSGDRKECGMRDYGEPMGYETEDDMDHMDKTKEIEALNEHIRKGEEL